MATSISREWLRSAREEMQDALREFGEKHGLTVTVGSASFMPGEAGNATFKVELATNSPTGEANTAKAAEFIAHAALYGFLPEHLFGVFVYAGVKYKLIGFSPRSTRFPLLAERMDSGKAYKLPITAADSLKTK